MGKKIAVLDEETIKKIAAGEVIERPASVVKELVENSLDAGARRISVEVSDGGKGSIKVADDGEGMAREDALMSFHRHTTSKLRKIEDLDSLRTLGFRGEALASICAVSRAEITTKPRGELEGTLLRTEGGKLVETRDVGCPEGTSVIVKDLFYNLPARRKHLRSARNELAHVTDIVTRYALARSDVHFSLEHGKTRILDSPQAPSLRETVANVFGPEVSKDMVRLEGAQAGISISGLVGKPQTARGTPGMQFFYVNGRYVQSRLLGGALKDAFGTLLPKNRYPVCVVFVGVDPARIDVNIHPTKVQVSFLDEGEVFEAARTAVKGALGSVPLVREATPRGFERWPGPPREGRTGGHPGGPGERPSQTQRRMRPAPLTIESYRRRFPQVPETRALPEMRIIGDYGGAYILGESGAGMVVLDQHAVHERILYEKLLGKGKDSQELIVPLTLELSPKEAVVLEEFGGWLKGMGFDIEPFGRNTCKIGSVPVVLGSLVSADVVRDILDDMATMPRGPEGGVEERLAQIVAKRSASAACKAAIKAGEKQSPERLQDLVKELYRSSNPHTCPHGRPTMIVLTKDEIDKRFLRT